MLSFDKNNIENVVYDITLSLGIPSGLPRAHLTNDEKYLRDYLYGTIYNRVYGTKQISNIVVEKLFDIEVYDIKIME